MYLLGSSSQSEQSALVCLPDDVLITILGYLDRSSQLILTQTHIRFLTIMPHIWRSRYKRLVIGERDGRSMCEKDFQYLIGSLQSTLNVFCMHIDNRQHFEILVKFVFPKLHEFTFTTNSIKFTDADMPRMIKAFPKLRTFSPQGYFTGKSFEGLNLLENLTLTHCKFFRVRYLFRILQIRKLKTLKLGVFGSIEIPYANLPICGIRDLEVLECNYTEMSRWILKRLKILTHLQQLTLCDFPNGRYCLEEVLRSAGRSRVQSVEIINHGFFSNELYLVFNLNIQIETLKIVRDVIRLLGREDIMPCLERVNQIHCISCVFLTEEDFCRLMSLKSTEIVALYGCRFNFNEYTFVADDIGNGRSKRLNLHLDSNMKSYKTYPKSKMIWKTEGEHELFKLHMETPNISNSSDAISIYFK